MTLGVAIDLLERRMKELCKEETYVLRLRHFVVAPKATLKIEADNQYFLFADTSEHLRIESTFGLYDLQADNVNELQYEHFGKIKVTNRSDQRQPAKFIQGIVLPIDTENTNP